jgi:RNA polymerase sigma-B factor
MSGVTQERATGPAARKRARGHTERLNGREVKVLFARWRHGELAARDELLERYAPLARNLARRYNNTSEPFEDLYQVAQLGLVKAAERFDPERGFPFQAFAIPTILGELRRHFRNCSWAVHVPRGVQERALEVRDVERMLSDEHGRAPTVQELAQFMELSTEEVLDAMQALRGYGTISLDAPRGSEPGDEDGSFVETLGEDDGRFELIELRTSLTEAVASLEPRQREMLRLRYFEELTQTQIAEKIGVSQMQVSRLLRRIIGDLRATVPEAT